MIDGYFEAGDDLDAAGGEWGVSCSSMVKNAEGLTKTYNRFHDPGEASAEITRLRELHAAMDRAVLDAYGRQDVQPVCGFGLDGLDLDDGDLADTLASAPDAIRDDIFARLLHVKAGPTLLSVFFPQGIAARRAGC